MNAADLVLPLFRCHKTVGAAKIESVYLDGCQVTVRDAVGFMRTVVSVDIFARATPRVGDYLVRYTDGYLSVSPAGVFEDGYTLEREPAA